MSIAEDIDNTENVTTLRLIKGGKEPPSENWLIDMPEDKIFFVREKIPAGMVGKAPSPIVNEFTIDRKFKTVVRLVQYVDGKEIEVNVHALTFSRSMELVEVW